MIGFPHDDRFFILFLPCFTTPSHSLDLFSHIAFGPHILLLLLLNFIWLACSVTHSLSIPGYIMKGTNHRVDLGPAVYCNKRRNRNIIILCMVPLHMVIRKPKKIIQGRVYIN